MNQETFSCYLVEKQPNEVTATIAQLPKDQLPPGEVLVAVDYSSLNYKDALAASGNTGVAKKFPHIPGVDAAGRVVESSSDAFAVGDQVIVTSYDQGSGRWGGWSEYVRVPAEWVVPLPVGLSTRQAMIYGTAGLTAAICLQALQHHGVTPESGEVIVTGASGGVGSMAVMLLAKLGYDVVAVTGKTTTHDRLTQWGAQRILDRQAVDDTSEKPLLKSEWAGGIDCVGGNTLATILRATKHSGCVAACGLVGGVKLPLTVYPFILRGVTLAGIDTAYFPYEQRLETWQNLANAWRPDHLDDIATEIGFSQLGEYVQKILQGEVVGRVIVSTSEKN